MSTNRTFDNMLNEYLPNSLLKEEFVKRDFVMSKVEKDEKWLGGTLIVPFKAAGASSVAFGALTDSNDIGEDIYVRGEVSGHREIWGSMIFNHRDLMEHDKVSVQNFLKLLPGTVEDFMDYMKNVVSVNLLRGGAFARVTVDGTVGGVLGVDRPDMCVLGQKIELHNASAGAETCYIIGVNMNAKTITVSGTRGGSALDVSAYLVADGTRIYHPGSRTAGFASLRNLLLSAANGGSSTIYGVTKTDYPYTQAINLDGTSITASSIVEDIFDALIQVRQFGRGNPDTVIMSFTNLGHCMKAIEASKGSFNVVPGSQKANPYGWMEITVGSVTKSAVRLVGVQEADEDVMFFIDWRGIKFHSNGFFRKRKSPDGTEYFEIRATTGYQYIIDVCLFGELVVNRPSYQGVIHSISI